ncbi:damage-control phosphatase ARMT1 family protein [Streptomyces sp. NBS 14/10]|uniref:damage-control phosphatase ARMT1 family protein n=1 Tax=Streptomyces sp. NBS 14/10 TaxID=1945643 RepID=UPI000B7F2E48|nr:damage-control phosphatase ARMT1 family protein [Streptomyces sp. NBS 14/10]KAK1183186.1 damage-control phosphatase ARMT1 family protein [Streptomyces sp. NBS 14/10]
MPETMDAPVILSNEPGSFARSVLAERHPALIERVRAAFPYGPGQHRALDALLTECAEGVITPLGPAASDHGQWTEWGGGYFGRSWFDVPFLWAESYFYRKLLEAVGYFATGPWQGIDPFRPFKQAELHTEEAEAELTALDRLALRPVDEQAQALLYGSLWGNRADLGFSMTPGSHATAGAESPLITDDSAALWSLLPAGGPNTVCLVADNAGRELVPDLLLIDHLLRHQHAEHITLHVKPYPYYVSDAMTADVIDCLRHLKQADGVAGVVGKRLWETIGRGRLTLRTHDFFCAPLPYADMPADLRQEFADATVTIMKGDLNYRRLVGDQLWPATTSFAERTGYFPSPVAALRTLKSDVIVGLDGRTEATLTAAHDQRWRTSGTHALIQVRR